MSNETVTITIKDVEGSSLERVVLLSKTAGEIIHEEFISSCADELAKRPLKNEEPVKTYELFHERSGQVIPDNTTLRDAGVRNGDVLIGREKPKRAS